MERAKGRLFLNSYTMHIFHKSNLNIRILAVPGESKFETCTARYQLSGSGPYTNILPLTHTFCKLFEESSRDSSMVGS
jgi:hypothetical protein